MRDRPLLCICLAVSVIITLAVTCGKGRLIRELRPSPLESAAASGSTVVLTGQVDQAEQSSNYQRLYLENNSIQYQDHIFQESKVIIYTDSRIQIHMGNKIRVRGEVSFFENARNPGNFDQKRYYQARDIHGQIWAEEIEIVDARVWKYREKLSGFRRRWQDELTRALGEEDGGAMSAIMLGEKSGMDQDTLSLLRIAGIGHIFAVSGLHLSFIGIGMYKIIRRITGSYPVGGVLGILFLMLYILMIGFTVSAVRALVMFLFRVGADMTGRHYDAPTALSAAAVAVLVWRPLSLYDGGFWLSFGAVFAILMVVPVVQEGISVYVLLSTNILHRGSAQVTGNRKGETQSSLRQNREDSSMSVYLMGVWGHVWQVILQGLTASIGINLVILPILLYYFFEFPLYSFILNLFVIPLMSVLLFLGMAGSLFALWLVPVSAVLFWICGGILWIYKMSCEITLHLPGARLVIGRPDMWQIAVYYGILFLG